jgi:hypothetical protein
VLGGEAAGMGAAQQVEVMGRVKVRQGEAERM